MNEDRSPNQHPLFIIVVMTFIAAVAGVICYHAMEDYRDQQFAHETFQPVQATILESKVKSRTRDGKRTYRPYVYYRYDVEGKGYRSKKYMYYYNLNTTRGNAEDIIARYPAGASVTAYYNPVYPKNAVLNNSEPDPTLFLIFITIFGAVYLLIVGSLIRQHWKTRLPSDEELFS